MQHKAKQADLEMNANLLKEELADLREIIMIYENGSAERKISGPSSVQKKLYKLFKLDDIKKIRYRRLFHKLITWYQSPEYSIRKGCAIVRC